MEETVQFVLRHSYAGLFLAVLVEQLGLPLPSVPILLAAGALSGVGLIRVAPALGLAVAACLIADAAWYSLGRLRGGAVLGLLCRISLEPDSCVRRTRTRYSRYGSRILLVAKFVPGINTVASPLAGMFRVPPWRFALLDGTGATLWAGAWFGAGWLLRTELLRLAAYALRMGFWILVLAWALLGAWLLLKYRQRGRTLREISVVPRIQPDELKTRIETGEPLALFDLRSSQERDPHIPGAELIAPAELIARVLGLSGPRLIVLYCS